MGAMHGAHELGPAPRVRTVLRRVVALACPAANGYFDADAEHEPPHRVAVA